MGANTPGITRSAESQIAITILNPLLEPALTLSHSGKLVLLAGALLIQGQVFVGRLAASMIAGWAARPGLACHAPAKLLSFKAAINIGGAQVKVLEASFDIPDPNPLSVELAAAILSQEEFGLTSHRAQGLQGFGVGVSAGASAFVGVLASADVVFDFQDKAEVHPRAWAGGSIKSGLSVSAGLELSFWVTKPTTGAIAGWLIDLYIPEFVVGYFIRFMYIKEREAGATEFTFSGVSLQFPLGIGLPLRKKKEKHPGLVAPFLAK